MSILVKRGYELCSFQSKSNSLSITPHWHFYVPVRIYKQDWRNKDCWRAYRSRVCCKNLISWFYGSNAPDSLFCSCLQPIPLYCLNRDSCGTRHLCTSCWEHSVAADANGTMEVPSFHFYPNVKLLILESFILWRTLWSCSYCPDGSYQQRWRKTQRAILERVWHWPAPKWRQATNLGQDLDGLRFSYQNSPPWLFFAWQRERCWYLGTWGATGDGWRESWGTVMCLVFSPSFLLASP